MQEYYQEHEGIGNIQRMIYLSDLEQLIEKERRQCLTERAKRMENFMDRQEELRQEYYQMLGWPLCGYDGSSHTPTMKMEPMGEDEQAVLYRCTVEVMPGLRFGGVLFRNRCGERLPLVIGQHGGRGTPEIISGIYDNGKTHNYNNMVRRVLACGVHVFAPQLLLWDQDKYHVHYDRPAMDRKLNQLGGSITALEIYAIMRCIDLLEKEPYVDEQRIGMVGLSYGGFYTLYTTAADPRIRTCIASGCLYDRLLIGWHDWTWQNCAHTFLDAEVGALIAPRGLKLQMGVQDEIFNEAPSRREFARLKAYYDQAGCAEKLYMEFFEGHHEFSLSDVTIDLFMDELMA